MALVRESANRRRLVATIVSRNRLFFAFPFLFCFNARGRRAMHSPRLVFILLLQSEAIS